MKYIQSCPNDPFYIWQVHLWLESLKEIGKSHEAVSLIFVYNRGAHTEVLPKWEKLEELYPEAEFVYYKDEDNVSSLALSVYRSVIRPYTLYRYWKDNPQMNTEPFFYCDADIVFQPNFNIDSFIDDKTCYLSDTLSYISHDYLVRKEKSVPTDRKSDYSTNENVIQGLAEIVKILPATIKENNLSSGGAQYLIKSVDALFWRKVMEDSINIYTYLGTLNKLYFPSEEEGYQKWCADMWAVLYNLWYYQKETKIIPEMDFSWGSSPAKDIVKPIYHNAGVTGKVMEGIPMFYKGAYVNGNSPFTDGYIEQIVANEKSKAKCSWFYAEKLLLLKKKYYITELLTL